MSWKNFCLIKFCALFSSKKRAHSTPKKILVVSTTALGDTLWGSPAIESLRKSFPEASLSLLTSPIGKEVLKTNPFIQKIYCIKKPLLREFFSLWKTLSREKFDTILIFHASQRLVFPLCALLGASRIIGTKGINKGLDSLLTHPLLSIKEHEILRRLRMVESIGGKIHTEHLSFIPENLSFSLPQGSWIAIHPGSKDSFKRWPLEHFVTVGKKLSQKTGYRILITGTKEELPLMEQISSQIPGALCLDTTLPLHAFAKVLSSVKILISNDTGPVHLACALKTPVVALYASTDPLLCGPHKASNALALSKPSTCTPCIKRKCLRPFCLLQIGPEEAIKQCLKLLASS
jgi:ADP-heptose:LPS heptosyltransferase